MRDLTSTQLLYGTAAGAIATVAMTAFMKAAKRTLPAWQQYPLPPRMIVEETAARAGLQPALSTETKRDLTVLSHYGYGAAGGAMYAVLEQTLPVDATPTATQDTLCGVSYGLAVWTLSYLGWLKLADFEVDASKQPWQRNALMIAAHVVWGGTLGAAFHRLRR